MSETIIPHRSVPDAFLEALCALARSEAPNNWWRDVLASDQLFIAVRRNSLNVYFRGASIFKIDWLGNAIIPTTHAKYLARQAQTYVPLINGQFQYETASLLWERYSGRETLSQMMKAASAFAGAEKTGLHPLIIGDRRVIDVEVALTRDDDDNAIAEEASVSTKATPRRQDRLDAAIVRNTPAGPTIAFYEAKHYSNPALRASADEVPPVIGQINDYEKALQKYAQSLAVGYLETAKALVAIDNMRRLVRDTEATALDPIIAQIAADGIPPIIDVKPHLLIFGFDRAQRDDPAWRQHLNKLELRLEERVRAVGNTTRQSVTFR